MPCSRKSSCRRTIDWQTLRMVCLRCSIFFINWIARGVALLDVVADFLVRLLIAVEHPAVLRIQTQLRNIVVVDLNQVIVAVFGNVDVRLHLARARAGIAQAGPRIQMPDHVHRDLDMLQRPPQ